MFGTTFSFRRIDGYAEMLQAAGFVIEEFTNLSKNQAKTAAETLKVIAQRRDKLLDIYGSDFTATIEQAWSALARAYQANFGYLLAVTHKPDKVVI